MPKLCAGWRKGPESEQASLAHRQPIDSYSVSGVENPDSRLHTRVSVPCDLDTYTSAHARYGQSQHAPSSSGRMNQLPHTQPATMLYEKVADQHLSETIRLVLVSRNVLDRNELLLNGVSNEVVVDSNVLDLP